MATPLQALDIGTRPSILANTSMSALEGNLEVTIVYSH